MTGEGPVEPLHRLSVGESGRIVRIAGRDPARLIRLSSLGVVPGARLRVERKRPAVVLSVGDTTLALDPAITADIYVTKIEEDRR